MIICKTPFRVSFFGGGTDFPEFFMEHGGAVLGTAINKHIYHTAAKFPSYMFDYSVRISYRQVECVRNVSQIKHRPFREILRYFGIKEDIEINLSADLPAFSGLGTSSSFTVGLINALSSYRGRFLTRDELARLAIHLERNVLKETVGYQDQVFAAYGGFNLIEFVNAKKFVVTPVNMSHRRMEELEQSLLLFYTKISRRAQDVEKKKIRNLSAITENLKAMYRMVEKAHTILVGNNPLSEFGELLDKTWQAKKLLSPVVSTPEIDRMYSTARKAGALGGKLLGAGGGGFMLFFVPQEKQWHVRRALRRYYEADFSMNAAGSSILHS